jgi:hypothetical protein
MANKPEETPTLGRRNVPFLTAGLDSDSAAGAEVGGPEGQAGQGEGQQAEGEGQVAGEGGGEKHLRP